jgi:predicted nucleic acid-binding protein
MEQVEYFFDTYAIFEIIKKNLNYKKYLNANFVLTALNLYEIYYNLRKEGQSKEVCENWLNMFLNKEVAIEYEDIINSSELKLQNKQISIPDAIGYVIAKRLKIKFLTGDKEFEHLSNVEFVK